MLFLFHASTVGVLSPNPKRERAQQFRVSFLFCAELASDRSFSTGTKFASLAGT